MVLIIVQYIVSVTSFILLKLFTRLEVYGQENLSEVKKPYIVVSNHESHLDPLLIAAVIWRYQRRLIPAYFISKDSFFNIPVFNLILKSVGAFPAYKKEGIDKSLAIPREILARDEGLTMFPEGRIISLRPGLGEGRRGAAVLGLTTKAQLVPMSVHTPAKLNIFKFLFSRPAIVVRVGQPFYLDKAKYGELTDEQTYAATAETMAHIATLYHRHTY